MFTTSIGDALLSAAYVFDQVAVGTVSAVSVRAVMLAPVVHPQRAVAATARETTSVDHWQLTADLPAQPAVAGHAVVEVELTAAVRGVVSEVVEVTAADLSGLADLDAIDARVVAADGALPADPALLARRRFEELLAAIAEHFGEVPSTAVATTLRDRGITDLETLLAFLAPPHAVHRLALTVVTDSTVPPTERTYRLTALVHIIDDLDDGLAPALTQISLTRATLAGGTEPLPAPTGMSARLEYPALLVVPLASLDDEDLPFPTGPPPVEPDARRAARLAELTTRLRTTAVVPVAI
ncbi:hypothetical protein [Micromonospora sp. NPDC049679]|uniref:hypothetical protein n=1 Tax=Micromonospora sp. NPDC049679 TaxID=3155920 RepID=UPI0033C9E9EB